MMALDLIACVAAAVAAGCLALRGLMLKPDFHAWATPPQRLPIALLVLAIGLGMAALSIGRGHHATAREALVYVLEAAAAAVFLLNLVAPRASEFLHFVGRPGEAMDLRPTSGEGRPPTISK